MKKIRSFKGILEKEFYNEIFTVVEAYVEDNPNRLGCSTRYVLSADEANVTDMIIKLVNISNAAHDDILFEAVVECELEIAETRNRNREVDSANQWFSVKCCATLNSGISNFRILGVGIYNRYNKTKKQHLSDALIPYISKEKLDDIAEEFLEKYFPEALRESMPISTYEIANRMGLTIEEAHITKTGTVFGQMYFDDCLIQCYDSKSNTYKEMQVSQRTILVDPKVYFLRNVGCMNNTIIHECVHWELHRKYFELERLYNEEAKAISCQVVEGYKKEKDRTPLEWMEWHANALAPRILMPASSCKEKIEALIRKNRLLLPDANITEIMESVVFELSEFFGVSKLAAKIRMIDLGYSEAIGVYTYVDDRYISNYAFEVGALKKGQTYTISAQDALIEFARNSKFKELINSGRYVYVDAHFCINDAKYVRKDIAGCATLTDYALMHIDECCLTFEIKTSPNPNFGIGCYTECVLCNSVISDRLIDVTYGMLPQNTSVDDRAKMLVSEANAMINIMRRLPATFGDTLIAHMDRLEITEEELVERSQVNVRTIQRMRNEYGYRPKYKTLVAICIGLKLQPLLSADLIRKSGTDVKVGFFEETAYQMLLQSNYMNSIYECNEILKAANIKPLTKEVQ